jgi:hypothetical protein
MGAAAAPGNGGLLPVHLDRWRNCVRSGGAAGLPGLAFPYLARCRVYPPGTAARHVHDRRHEHG